MEIFERLKYIRKTLNLTQTKFAKEIGLSQTSLGMIEVGDRKVQDRHIKTICSLFNVNENWFRTGNGEMFIKVEDSIFKQLSEKYNLNEKDLSFIKHYLNMNPQNRQYLLNMILNMADAIRADFKIIK
jgi:transcriptional regulator with XRE-family HTH domain